MRWSKFNIRREFVKEMIQHAFYSEPFKKNMMHSFTPFCIQKMSQKNEQEWVSLEKCMDFASHMVENDFIKKENTLKLALVTKVLGFISAISNTQALSWVLFTSSSPLTKDLQDLYEIVVDGYQN